MDVSHGPLTLFFDSPNLRYSEPLADRMGLDLAKMPAVAACAEVVGEVTTEAAAATGLAVGTPVVAGMCDGTAAALEAGLTEVGDAVEMTGQSTVVSICADAPYLGRDSISLVHAIPGRYLAVGALVATGGALRWFRDQLGEPERLAAQAQGIDPFELLSAEAAGSPAGANRLLFLPYMFGERSPIWDTDARGVFFGLSLASTKADMVRAILEGAAFGLRHNLEAAAAAGFRARTLACVGGGRAARSGTRSRRTSRGCRSACRPPPPARPWAMPWPRGWGRASTPASLMRSRASSVSSASSGPTRRWPNGMTAFTGFTSACIRPCGRPSTSWRRWAMTDLMSHR